MRGKVVVLLGLGLMLTAPTVRAQSTRSEIVLRGHLRDMRDDMRGWSMAWGRQMRAEALLHSRMVRERALASARVARTEGTISARWAREAARAVAREHRDDMRSTMRIRIPPVHVHINRSRPI